MAGDEREITQDDLLAFDRAMAGIVERMSRRERFYSPDVEDLLDRQTRLPYQREASPARGSLLYYEGHSMEQTVLGGYDHYQDERDPLVLPLEELSDSIRYPEYFDDEKLPLETRIELLRLAVPAYEEFYNGPRPVEDRGKPRPMEDDMEAV